MKINNENWKRTHCNPQKDMFIVSVVVEGYIPEKTTWVAESYSVDNIEQAIALRDKIYAMDYKELREYLGDDYRKIDSLEHIDIVEYKDGTKFVWERDYDKDREESC